MQRDKVIGVVAILVIIIVAVLYMATKPAPARAPATAEVTGGSGTALLSESYTEHAAYYDITAHYASSTPLRNSVSESVDIAAIALMKNFVADIINQFKIDGNFTNLTTTDIKTLGFDRGRKYKLNIVYLIASSARTVSYIFTTYEDTGGAHGNTFFHTFTFDKKTGAELALADLFSPGADYLGALSSIARAKLPAVIGQGADAGFISGGTTPDEKNFQNFFFDSTDFVILFDPYAVAPYSSGPQTLRIPVSDFSSILKPEFH